MLFLPSYLGALIISILIAHVSAATPPRRVNCKQFSPDPSTQADMRCVEVENYPMTIAGSSFDLYHWSHGWTPTESNKYALSLIPSVAQQVLGEFSQWCRVANLTVILVKAIPGKPNIIGLQENSADGLWCYVRLQKTMGGTLQFEQTIAHELYHCTQGCERPSNMPEVPYTTWWIEGTADYFANYFFPSAQAGEPTYAGHFLQYDIRLPLWGQPDPGTHNGQMSALFFMSLNNSGWSNFDIHRWAMHHPFTYDASDERHTLSSDSKISSEFTLFAQRFVDKKILFSNGVAITPAVPLVPIPETITKDIAPSILWSLPTFTAKLWQVSFPELGDEIIVTVDTDDSAAVLNYRIQGTSDWHILSKTSTLTITNPCEGQEAVYDFLLTSTIDDETSVGSINFKVDKKKECKTTCNDLGKPLDSCLIGAWVLNDASMQATLLAAEQKVDPLITVAVSGGSTFTISKPHESIMTFENMEINIGTHVGGAPYQIDTKVSGSISAGVANQGDGKFCWMDPVAQGTTTFVMNGGTPWVLGLGNGYTDKGLVVNYVCTNATLTINGVLKDKSTWTYVYDRSGAPEVASPGLGTVIASFIA